MSERNEDLTPEAADPVARLVRLAGARTPVPPERALRAEALVRDAWEGGLQARRRRRTGLWASGLAAAAMLAIVVAMAWERATTPPPPRPIVATVERVNGTATIVADDGTRPLLAGEALRAGDVLGTAAGGRVALRLAGGSSLRVDTGSRVALVDDAELRLERGAVYVDSQGGPGVLVATTFGSVEERGTQFEVRVAPESLRVRVREGAVRLAANRRAFDSAAGSELVLDSSGRLQRNRIPAHGEAWQWVQEIAPSFRLEGRTLGDFLAWAGRESGSPVAWAEPMRAAASSAVVLHGSVDGLPPEQALAAVLPTCGLASRRDGSTIVIFANAR